MCTTGTYNIDMEVKAFNECVDYFNDIRHHKDKYILPTLVNVQFKYELHDVMFLECLNTSLAFTQKCVLFLSQRILADVSLESRV